MQCTCEGRELGSTVGVGPIVPYHTTVERLPALNKMSIVHGSGLCSYGLHSYGVYSYGRSISSAYHVHTKYPGNGRKNLEGPVYTNMLDRRFRLRSAAVPTELRKVSPDLEAPRNVSLSGWKGGRRESPIVSAQGGDLWSLVPKGGRGGLFSLAFPWSLP